MNELNDYTYFTPERILLSKYLLQLASIISGIIALVYGFAYITNTYGRLPDEAAYIITYYGTIVLISVLVLGTIYAIFYFSTINYSLSTEEIIVRRGLITRSQKIVTYRTITNLDIKRSFYDQLLGIGSIEVQTAGFSGNQSGPEERLDGLTLFQIDQIQSLIMRRVRSVKGSPGLSQDEDFTSESDILIAMLSEIKELRKTMEEYFTKY